MSPINIVVVDDHGIVRDGLRALLDGHFHMNVVGSATNGKDAVLTCERLTPDVVVMDLVLPELSEQIFERLFQASDPSQAGRQGLGLGLYICKELVVRQGGRIWATSTPGQGAVFSVTLPVFSMRNLLSATLEKPGSVVGPLMLIVVEMGSPVGWLTDVARAEDAKAAREWLQRCLHPDADVLLPKMGSAGPAELFFIVASTDPVGGEALIARIRQRFEERESEQKSGLSLSISSHSIPVARANRGVSKSASFEAVAAVIQALVNEEFSSRMVANA